MSLSPTVKPTTERIGQAAQPERAGRSRIRAAAGNIILHLHPNRVPAAALRFTYTWGLGGISATLALMLVATGVLLMFRYEPTIDRAYLSIKELETTVAFGSLVRAIHHWSANLLVITTFLHLVRVFLTGGFKEKRFVNWLVGIGLLLLVLTFNFTGYLLPWDQLAYWAITVSTSMLNYIPVIGAAISNLVLAGPSVGQGALSNFYALHVAVLPLLMTVTLAYHFWKVRKDGGISQPVRNGENDAAATKRVATIPHLVQREFTVALIVIVSIALWSMLVPAPLKDLADATQSPNPAKAAWYFMGLQELLLHMHTLAAMGLIGLVLLGIAVLPRWDRQDDNIGLYFRSATGKKATITGTALGSVLPPILVIVDEYWLDLPAMLPTWPAAISNGLLPFAATLAGLTIIYFGLRRLLKANHSEALMGLFTFIIVSLVALTIIGVFFRGPNMALMFFIN